MLEESLQALVDMYSENTPQNRIALTDKIDALFEICDQENISRPNDFNVTTNVAGEIVVYFAQTWTK